MKELAQEVMDAVQTSRKAASRFAFETEDEDLSYAEIGNVLSTFYCRRFESLLFRARENLRKTLIAKSKGMNSGKR